MLTKIPKNSDKYFWTTHSIYKMHQYGLSEQKIRSVIRAPYRKEEGIVKNTIAVMQPVSPKIINNKKIWKQEIWVMFQTKSRKYKVESIKPKEKKPNTLFLKQNLANQQIRIISAWRYPGVSPERNPIPEEILQEIANLSEK